MAYRPYSKLKATNVTLAGEKPSERVLVAHGDVEFDMTGYSGSLRQELWPLMLASKVTRLNHCPVCGRWLGRPDEAGYRGEMHHIVFRSAGGFTDPRGRKMEKPTVSLCGFGNSGGCHGLAHGNGGHLFFRVVPHRYQGDWMRTYLSGSNDLEFLVTDEPDYQTALSMDGWKEVR